MEFSLIELVTAVSSFAALLTAIIVFFTLIEMKRQRQSAYKPDLMFKPIRFSFSADFFDVLDYKIASQKDDGDSKNEQYKPTGQIYNIGLGSAKNLYLTLHFDYRKAIKLVNELIDNIDGKFNLIISLENNLFKVKIKEKGGIWINIENDLKCDIDYLLPVSIANEPAGLLLPNSYVLLLGFYFIFSTYIKPENDILPNLKGFPELRMVAKFNDIEEKTYKKSYRIDSRYLSYQFKRNDSGFLNDINVDFLLEFNAI